MSHAYLLQENGHQIQLEQQSNTFLILESADDVGIHLAGQPHATQAFYVGPRPEQLIPTQFTFKLISCLITRTGFRVCIRSGIKVISKSTIKVKSHLLQKFKETFGIKSSLLLRERFNTVKVKSSILVLRETKLGVFANTKNKNMKKVTLSKFKDKKKKELLLRRLKEILDDG